MEQPYPVKAFIEKPDKTRAEQYIESGNYFWNSGMFAFHIGTLLADGQNLCKDIAEPFINSNPNDPLQIANAYIQCQAQSIDYASHGADR
ncbi:MAG: sugar phosphate nucleotidyltransferase [Syntrophomonadaceae bacterium]